jgi:precorrin-2 dehydrogenase/sirohydrochlorin ferrochelatase
MLPLMLDLSRLTLILIGDDAKAERRLALLDAADAADLTIYAERPSASLALAAGHRLVRRLPSAPEVAAARVVFISDKHAPYCRNLAVTARAAGALLHVEDEPALCDVQAPAVLRRGELTIAVSTGGRAPGLAVQLKRWLGTLFGPEWQGRIDELATLRRRWRANGADADTVAQRIEAWLSPLAPPPLRGRMSEAEGLGDDTTPSQQAVEPAATALPAALARRRPPQQGGRGSRWPRPASSSDTLQRRSG